MMCGLASRRGNAIIPIFALVTTFILLLMLAFAICIYKVNVYTVVYNYKMDLFNLNRNVIMSVNIDKGKYGIYEFDESEYRNRFITLLKREYNLDDDLKNGIRGIKEIQILEYKVKDEAIYVSSNIIFEPIIFKNLFKDKCNFRVDNTIKIEQYI